MRSNTALRQSERVPHSLPSLAPLAQGLTALAGGLALFFIMLVILVIGYNLWYTGSIYPGVSAAGVDLSGQPPKDAALALSQRLVYPESGKIVLKDGDKTWIVKPAELGLFLDPQTSAQAAYKVGRSGGLFSRIYAQFDAWFTGADIPPLLVYDERVAQRYLRGIAAQVDRPTVEASLNVNGLEVVARPGQVGRTLDVQAMLLILEVQLRSLTDGIIPLVVHENPPAILDASQQAEEARRILSSPLKLAIQDPKKGDPGPWTLEQTKLAEMLTIERVDGKDGQRFQVGLKTESLRQFLQELAPKLARNPSNARFIFNDDTRQLELIQSAVIGRSLDVDATLQAINQKLAQGEHSVGLSLTLAEPMVTDKATGQQLGITELVSSYTSYFRGSSAARMQNIQAAASRFHGVLVPPGATFSMADALGDVTLDNGYAEALIILGGRTIKGVGGGVCQVSTTLFRTVFFGGFPVIERHPHAYRVGYYEQTATGHDADLAGLDATVFVPVVDFKFTNDTSHWLLMETYTNKSRGTLTWKFYSTSDGRKVKWETTGPQNIVDPPEPLYEENPNLKPGEIRQVDWAAEGADITVTRRVIRGGQVLFDDEFTTHYMPWRDVFQYGPGTEVP